jgi:endoglycosylceramidase
VPALALGLCLAPAAAAAPTAPLSQHGRWVTDARGRVVVLHGVNMVYKRPPYHAAATGFDAQDARFLRREGFNTVRLGLIYAGVEPAPGSYDAAYLEQVARSFRALARRHIFVMLDFHQDLYNERFQGEGWPDWAVQDDGLPAVPQAGFPDNYLVMPALNRAFDHFWANDVGPGGVGLQDRYAAAWRRVAERFRRGRYLLGYDLLNEPWPGTGWQACANPEGCPAFDTGKLTPFSQRATGRIREVDRRRIVWYEPNVIFNEGAKTSHGDTGPRAGMSFHVYCLAEDADRSPGDPVQAGGCETFEELPFDNAEAQSARTGDALLLTEFGATDDLGIIERMVDRADAHMVGWQYWHYCTCDDPTTTGTGDTQALVLDPRRPPSGDNLKLDKLLMLSRPYPQAIAGTPRRYGFERGPRRFELEYATARPGGGRYRFRADTQVFVPRRHYPTGYDVYVQGGQAISRRNARHLRVRTCRGRGLVKVTVAPGKGSRRSDCRVRRGRLP